MEWMFPPNYGVDQYTLEQNRENAIQNAIHPPRPPGQKQENEQ
jgi:hypothetical protein